MKYGPITATCLKEMARNGQLQPDDLVRRAVDTKWVRAEQLRGLFTEVPAAQSNQSIPAVPAPVPVVELCHPGCTHVAEQSTVRKEPAKRIDSRHEARAEAQVVPDPSRCVQCGICSYNCPMEIDVRAHAHRGIPVFDSHCLTCSECVKRCPRGVLSFERIPLFTI